MADKKKRRRTDSDSDSQPFKHLLKSDEQILQMLKSFSSSFASSSTSKPLTLADLSLASTCREVSDLPLSSVQSNIESLVLQLAHQILSGQGFSFTVPSRASTNQLSRSRNSTGSS
ncbi:DNA topoisomerase 6 subunit A-like protein [Corchorus olitorius]|uniref:DNA topoisomerase 6 subunit A-like protein n=1 Tax=Corchorus olitorius TaxID=93759 RepID=A0A1R3K980_9ROSI|nr:DNA topoisomerase 6 subunit A-like protein [Corchorus olitorius]